MIKRSALLTLALATSLGASMGAQTPRPQGRPAASDRRIPIQKTRAVPIDTVVLRRVDTVTLLRVDTVYVTTAAPTIAGMLDTLMKTDTLKCTNKVFPVPIPIPIPGTDHPGGLGTASTAPEPATAWLVGVGLVALGFVWGRRDRTTKT
ncbi:MAG TPA: PEP-CTERM sorting domain-containing protein [Gemmatimonadaceae bacterium]|nr:PEP-CTERM sorting domain-containing protein [Gemmatimonadaceae bacterium]